MIKKEELFKIGRFAKPHGVKGELSLLTTSDVLEEVEDPYIVCEIEGIMVPFFIEEFRYKSDAVTLVKLEYVNNEEAARELVNRDVYFPLDAVEEDKLAGEMTWDSFTGYTVFDSKGACIGSITAIDEATINVLFEIETNGKKLLFPAAEELITELDSRNKRITVIIPEGLLEL